MRVLIFTMFLVLVSTVSSWAGGDMLKRGERIQPKGIDSEMPVAREATEAVTPSVIAPPAASFADRQKPVRQSYVPGEITVKFKEGIDLEAQHLVVSELKGTIAYTSPYLGFHKVLIPEDRTVEEMVDHYMEHPFVKYAEPNTIGYRSFTPNDEYFALQWNFDAQHLNMPAAWDIELGGNSSVVVAVLDEGVAYENFMIPDYEQSIVQSPDGMYHIAPDLVGVNFVTGYDFVNDDAHPNDTGGHGTHVAGTIAQATNNSIGVAGMAFNCSIMPVRVLGDQGGTAQWLADGISYAWQNGADVLNMSLGWPVANDSTGLSVVHDAIINATNNGVVSVVSSGNEGVGTVSYPAAFSQCISVGASRWDDTRAIYSQYGTGLDITAPGGDMQVDQNNDGYADGILQNTYTGFTDTVPPPKDVSSFAYHFSQGTSMAAPTVSGLCALLISHGITGVSNVKNAIYQTATDAGSPGYDTEYGWGIIDPVAALGGGGGVTTLLNEDFETGEATGWTTYDVDNDGYTWWLYSESIEGFDLAHSGDIGVGVVWNPSGNDDWLVSPEMSLPANADVSLTFWAKSIDPSYLEDFNVLVSTSGSTPADFTHSMGEVRNVPATWNQYEVTLDTFAGADIHFAIQCVSVDEYFLFVDDFLVEAEGGTGIGDDPPLVGLPRAFRLYQNQPNPFNPSTTITFDIPGDPGEKRRVEVTVYDIRGRRVKKLVDSDLGSGNHELQWNGRNDRGEPVSSGIYLYTLKTGGEVSTRKMTMLK